MNKVVTVGIEADALSTYLLPFVYAIITVTCWRLSLLLYQDYKHNKKDRNIKGLSWFFFSVGFDAIYSFIAVFAMFIIGILNPQITVVSPLYLMLLPNTIVMVTSQYFYWTMLKHMQSKPETEK